MKGSSDDATKETETTKPIFHNSTIPLECQNYKILNDPTRNSSHGVPPWRCDKTGSRSTSPDWKGKNWYRFQPPAGTGMPETVVPDHRCATSLTGWIKGSHPSGIGQVGSAKVCFHWGEDDCQWPTEIHIRNCGSYFCTSYLIPQFALWDTVQFEIQRNPYWGRDIEIYLKD